jgi:hypothetical protein
MVIVPLDMLCLSGDGEIPIGMVKVSMGMVYVSLDMVHIYL